MRDPLGDRNPPPILAIGGPELKDENQRYKKIT